MERFVQVELCAKALDHFRGEPGIERIHLAGFSGGQMDDQERNHRDKKEGNDFLYDTPANKRQHGQCSALEVPKVTKVEK